MIDRRKMLAGLAGLGATTALPAWAQSIRRQSDPYGQVDPYADPRNGFPSGGGGAAPSPGRVASSPFDGAPRPPIEPLNDRDHLEIADAMKAYKYHLLVNPAEAQGPPHPNRDAQNALKRFCEPLFKAADRANLPWEVILTDWSMANGFTVGGGKVAITSTAVEICDHPGELASVVAHEVGHVDMRHTQRDDDLREIIGAWAKSSKLAADNPSFVGIKQKLLAVAVKGYNRANEFEADAHVITVMDRVGMNPGRSIGFQKKIMHLYNLSEDEKTCLLDTHPATIERIAAFQAELGNERPDRFVPPGWAELKRLFPTPPELRWG